MSELRDVLRAGVEGAGLTVADALGTEQQSEGTWRRIVSERRRRLAWQAGGIATAVLVTALLVTGLWPSGPARFEPADTTPPEQSLTVGAQSPVEDPTLVIGVDTPACGSPLAESRGVVVHQEGVLPDGTTLEYTNVDLAQNDPLMSAAAAEGYAIVRGAVRAHVSTPGDLADAGLRLRSAVVTTVGGVVMGWIPLPDSPDDGTYSEGTKRGWTSTALEPTINACEEPEDDLTRTPSEARVVIAQMVDAHGLPVATWTVAEGSVAVGPEALGDVSLACGAAPPDASPPRFDPGVLANPDVNSDVWLGPPDDGTSNRTIVAVHLQLREWDDELTYFGTVMLVDGDQVVGTAPVTPSLDDAAYIQDMSAPEAGTLVHPGVCHSGSVSPETRETWQTEGVGRVWVRFAIIAVDPQGTVVGAWLEDAENSQLVPSGTWSTDE